MGKYAHGPPQGPGEPGGLKDPEHPRGPEPEAHLFKAGEGRESDKPTHSLPPPPIDVFIVVVFVLDVDNFSTELSAFEGAPVRRACVPRYLGHTAEGNPCRMQAPPPVVLFKVEELAANAAAMAPDRERINWTCQYFDENDDERKSQSMKGGVSMPLDSQK
jgi:hypothetical protein